MKKHFLTLLLLLVASYSHAQAPVAKGKAQINVGVGFSSWGVPVYGGFDVGVHPDMTLGLEVAYRGYNGNVRWGKNKYGTSKASIWSISGNFNYHLNKILELPKEWNLYAGVNVGYYIWTYSTPNTNSSDASGLGLGGQIGGRYFFNDKLGLNLEIGGGNQFSNGKIGLTFKL